MASIGAGGLAGIMAKGQRFLGASRGLGPHTSRRGLLQGSLAIGALGEATFAKMIQAIWPRGLGAHTALFAHAIALACAFALLSALHVVIGELVPKTLSLARAERVALLVALPFHWFLNTFHWAIHLLDGISGAIVKALGVTSAQVHGVAHSTEELQIQIQQMHLHFPYFPKIVAPLKVLLAHKFRQHNARCLTVSNYPPQAKDIFVHLYQNEQKNILSYQLYTTVLLVQVQL